MDSEKNNIDIKKYEKMVKLDLPQNEKEAITKSVKMLLNSFEALETVDIQDVQPMFTPLPLHNVLREDNAEKLFTREEVLENAPEQYEGYFQVPKTLD